MTSPIQRVALFLIGYLLILLAASIPKGMTPPRFADIVWGGLASLAILALTQYVLRRERRGRRDVGLEPDARSAVRFLAGFALGVAVYALTVALISLILGPIRLSEPALPSATRWLVVITSFLALSCMEELGFRAYALRTLIPAVGVWPAQLSIAIAFGLSHVAFGWAWPAVVMGVMPSAFLFGVVAVRSGGLAMPIGLHAALNVAQWTVGAKETPGVWILNADPASSERMTAFAPFVAMTVTLLVAVVIARWPSRGLGVLKG